MSTLNPIELLVQTILNMVATIEEKDCEMFHVAHPDLEKTVWEALDSRNKGKLHLVIKALDELR